MSIYIRRVVAVIVLFSLMLISSRVGAEEPLENYTLALMLKSQPRKNVAWAGTYESTAAAISKTAAANSLYPGPDGIKRTISVMVSVAFFESSFNPKAVGDCPEKDDKGMCIPGSVPRSFCAFQIDKSNFAYLGVTKEKLLEDIEACAVAGIQMMKASFNYCKGWKPEERLNQYATGGNVCVRPKHDEGEHRMRKAQWLFRWKNEEDKKQP